MKFLHVMSREKFTASVSQFYSMFFHNGEHEICYLNTEGADSLISDRIDLVQKEIYLTRNLLRDFRTMWAVFSKYDYIVMHSYLFPSVVRLFLHSHRSILKKVIWIEWGADLYSWESVGRSARSVVNNIVNRCLRTRCHSMVGIFPPDCDYYQKAFPKAKVNVYYAPYCGGSVDEEFFREAPPSRLPQTKAQGEPVYIQIGQNALSTLNHIDVLNTLARFRDENIRILLPISYGGTEAYADEVQRCAERIFGEKAICLRDVMPVDAYFQLITRVDIAIFNTTRQCGLGNIYRLIYRNTKLYMPEDCVMYSYFVDNGITINKYEELAACSYQTFIEDMRPYDWEKADIYFERLRDLDYQYQLWKEIYDDLKRVSRKDDRS